MGIFVPFAIESAVRANLTQREFYDGYGISIVVIDAPDAGTLIEQHQHDHDHVTHIARGSIKASVDRTEPVDYKEGDSFVVKAFKTHVFYTLEPNTRILCVTNTLGEESEKARRVNTEAPKVLPDKFRIEE